MTPQKYEIYLDPTETLDLGKYSYGIVVEMTDYPSADWGEVTRSENPFYVKINPCLVTSLEPAAIPTQVQYHVGNRLKSVSFSFAQSPCDYPASYEVSLASGSQAPSFIEQLERHPLFNLYTVDERHVGNYTFAMRITLDNLALFAALDPDMDDYISDINDPANTYQNSGATLVYESSFEFEVEILPPESEYEEADNTAPYLYPPPSNQMVEVGEPFEYFVGELYDAESANQTVYIEVDLGRAGRFAKWDDIDFTLNIDRDETGRFDTGFYDIRIRVWDNFDTVVIEDYVECADRVFTTEAEKRACKDRVAGETIYNFKLEVRDKQVVDVEIPPEATEVIYTYEGQVYGVEEDTVELFYATASDDGTIDVAALEGLEIQKLDVYDLARQEDQNGVDLAEAKQA